MRNVTSYEWVVETVNPETDDIDDCWHTDSLPEKLAANERLALVRDVGNDGDGLVDRQWAYVADGTLPEFFADAWDEPTSARVPQKFRNAFSAWKAAA